jgi:L-lactate utilization protein LutC
MHHAGRKAAEHWSYLLLVSITAAVQGGVILYSQNRQSRSMLLMAMCVVRHSQVMRRTVGAPSL